FCHHAFDQGNPKEGYEELSRGLVHYAGGIPSAIETFTDFLSGKVKDEWYQILEKLVKNPCLDSLGVYLTSVSSIVPFKSVGPCGGSGSPYDDRAHTTVRKIFVVFESVIHSITIEYDDDGCLVRSCPHGGLYAPRTSRVHQIKLDYPYEYLTSISGYMDKVLGKERVRSLTFQSNKRKYGPFGQEKGRHFPVQWNSGKIVGFFGQVNDDSQLESIRAHLELVSHIHPFRNAGPFGDEGGRPWDDGNNSNLRKIVLSWGRVINSIWCVYEKDGIIVEGCRHGRTSGSNEFTVNYFDINIFHFSFLEQFGRSEFVLLTN
ncbi:hypothetical protein CRG98_048032, partial [Punica granatum]